MEKKLEKQQKENEKQLQQNQVLYETIEELGSENRKLREQVDYLIRQLFGRKSEKIDPRQLKLLLGLVEESVAEPEVELPPPPEPPKPRRKRRQIKDRLPENLPVRTTFVDPPAVIADPDSYRYIGEETLVELSVTPPVYFRKETVRRKYVEKDDRTQPPIIAPAAPRLIENSFASVDLLIDIILKKYADHLPLYRQEQIMKRRYGIDLSRKTMSGWMWQVGNWLRPICGEMKEEFRASGYLQADETPIRYLDPGTGRSHKGYLWVYHAPGLGVVFEWHLGRGAVHMESMLGNYGGDLQCDGYPVYRTFNRSRDKDDRYTIYACWTHARRYFFNAKDDSAFAAQVVADLRPLYRIEDELRKAGATAAERQSRRRTEAMPLLVNLEAALKDQWTNYRPKSLTGRAINYTLGLWEELRRYAETGHVEIDNNLVENCIRPTAIGKKNWLFFGSPKAGWQSAIIFSILETCRKLNIDQREYLRDVFTRLPTLTVQQARQLTPARWRAARTAAVA